MQQRFLAEIKPGTLQSYGMCRNHSTTGCPQYIILRDLCSCLALGLAFLYRRGSAGQSPGGWSFPGREQLCPGCQLDHQLILFLRPAAPPQPHRGSRSRTTQHLSWFSAHRGCSHHQGVVRFLDHCSDQCEFLPILLTSHDWWPRSIGSDVYH